MSEAELKVIFDKWSPLLVSVALGRIGDKQAAENIVSDAYLKLYRSFETGSPYKFLLQYIKWRCGDWKKAKERSDAVHDKYGYGAEAVEHMKSDLVQHILANVKYLPEGQRRVFMMKYVDGYEYKEISDITGLNIDTVRVRVFKALQFLRRTVVL